MKRHFAEHMAELAPLVQILDAPVPQLVDNVMDAFRFLDLPMTEQVIEVPRISCPPCLFVLVFLYRRRRNSWWMCRLCCLPRVSPCRSPSRSLTLQFSMSVLMVEVYKDFSQDRVRSASRSSAFLFRRVVVESGVGMVSPRTEFNSDFFFVRTHF